MRSVLITQAIVAIAAASAGYLWKGGNAALAALFGASIALVNGLLLAWRLKRGQRPVHADPQRHLRALYLSVFERWLVVGALFAIGIGALKLLPQPLLAAFIAGQLALMVAGLRSRND